MQSGMILSGVAASENTDSSGEILKIAGCDISTLTGGKVNYEHIQGDNEDKEENPYAPGEEVVGKIIFSKKVFDKDDCANDDERKYWDELEVPFIYIKYRLYDMAGHRGAQALAAAIRDAHANDEKITVRLSIEGATLEKKGNVLESSMAKAVAATWGPCNRACDVTLLSDPGAPSGFKDPSKKNENLLADLLGMDKHEIPTGHPNRQKLGKSQSESYSIIHDPAPYKSLEKIVKGLLLKRLSKTLTAGGYNVAPSNLTGGAALGRESLQGRIKRTIADYKPKGSFDKSEFQAFAKAHLPEIDDKFMDYFADVAKDYHLKMKKSEAKREFKLYPEMVIRKAEYLTIELRKTAEHLCESKSLVQGTNKVNFAGKPVVPGRAKTADGEYDLLHEDDGHYTGVPKGTKPGQFVDKLVRFPKSKEGTHYHVVRRPAVLVTDL